MSERELVMLVRIAIIGVALALAGCGHEPDRSRVVPASGAGKEEVGGAGHPAPADIHKVEMH
jgi:hypothetical protein